MIIMYECDKSWTLLWTNLGFQSVLRTEHHVFGLKQKRHAIPVDWIAFVGRFRRRIEAIVYNVTCMSTTLHSNLMCMHFVDMYLHNLVCVYMTVTCRCTKLLRLGRKNCADKKRRGRASWAKIVLGMNFEGLGIIYILIWKNIWHNQIP